ncbi:MAG: DUF4314 domain-containing protein [Candidatus Lokiarchaeota archaeon]|nr:DUF4314 domain-containing protein [Candidatus Lokiarchaeota archaeon]
MVKVGDRVRLITILDPYSELEKGIEGIVTYIDSLKTIHVRWDNGTNIGLVPGTDSYKIIS